MRNSLEVSGLIERMYDDVCLILHDEIEEIPKYLPESLSFDYYGFIQRDPKTFDIQGICLSLGLFRAINDCIPRPLLHLKIMQTICHEIAHITYWSHGKGHEELTKQYMAKCTDRIHLDYGLDFTVEYENIEKTIQKYIEFTNQLANQEMGEMIAERNITNNRIIRLKDIVKSPKSARAKLRKAGLLKPKDGWVWANQLPHEIAEVLGLR